jgi:predicted Abi (CAAX) family protease
MMKAHTPSLATMGTRMFLGCLLPQAVSSRPIRQSACWGAKPAPYTLDSLVSHVDRGVGEFAGIDHPARCPEKTCFQGQSRFRLHRDSGGVVNARRYLTSLLFGYGERANAT